jgi:hypothetical protein
MLMWNNKIGYLKGIVLISQFISKNKFIKISYNPNKSFLISLC